ncbi:hypothetical protein [Methylocella silvestris]|uniref:Bacteriophage protein n=1 Tax=Methylocella silvestris TaxID=199596 RepID=A0A2J7TG21_METSI|nr:hypothetical protein [Methylocella silvestris]PNG25708.1 hypothetical protein CR492_12385 [Methylocella silvestris]
MVKISVTSSIDHTGDLMRAIKALTKNVVMVGVPAANADRESTGGKPGANNAQIGYIMETGSPTKNIPARPFLVPGVQSIKGEIVKSMRKSGMAALGGNVEQVEKEMHAIGLKAQVAVQIKLSEGPFTPLSPKTVYARKHRKEAPRDSDQPLIDTGQLRAAIKYVIMKSKDVKK